MMMGASNIAPSFATLYGARLIDHKKAVLWFTVFVLLGAVVGGYGVVNTLGTTLIPSQFISVQVVLAILLAALGGLILANLLGVPESTSWVTVFAIAGVGAGIAKLELAGLFKIIPFWIILPVLAFIITYFIYKLIYPPRFTNLWLYQALFNREDKLKKFAFVVSCYLAFAAGTNNVANAVGPLVGGGLIKPLFGLIIVALLFGLGGLILGKRVMKTLGQEIVPLGLISASLVALITATLLIFASAIGVPQSLVQLSALSIMAIAAVKHEQHILKQKTIRKIVLTWLISPTISFSLGWLLCKLLV